MNNLKKTIKPTVRDFEMVCHKCDRPLYNSEVVPFTNPEPGGWELIFTCENCDHLSYLVFKTQPEYIIEPGRDHDMKED